MLLPDQRICCRGVEIDEVAFSKRPQLDEVTNQVRLKVEVLKDAAGTTFNR